MAEAATIDVAEVIERQSLGAFTIALIVVSWLVTFFDGYDMLVISYTSKYLIHDFHLTKVMLGYVITSAVVGTFFGSMLFGYLGDRIGRRPAILLSTGTFGVLTSAVVLAQSYPQLMGLRFLDGIALGGAVPLVWALNVEFVPRRFRARAVTLIMMGFGFGATFAGPIARLLIPSYGWQGVFWFGGIASLAATVILLAFLPESLRYMARTGAPVARIVRTLKRVAPRLELPANPSFVVADESAKRERFNPTMLFRGELRLITPLLWMSFLASSVSTYFITSWGPLILEDMGFGANGAAWLSAGNSLCGAVGGLAIMGFTDRKGPISVAALPAIAVPLLLIAGLAPMGLGVFLVLSLVLSVFLGGGHYAIQSIIGMFYPSTMRASGSGWAGSVAKIGSMSAPVIGGYVLSTSLPLKNTYALLAVCPAVFGVCALCIGIIARRQHREDANRSGGALEAIVEPAE